MCLRELFGISGRCLKDKSVTGVEDNLMTLRWFGVRMQSMCSVITVGVFHFCPDARCGAKP